MASVKIIGQVGVKVMPDTSDFKKKLKSELEAIEKSIGNMMVDVIPELDKSAEKRLKAEMAALKKRLDGNVNLGLNLDGTDVAVVEAMLDSVARNRTAKIDVDFNGSALQAAGNSLLMLSGARPQIDALKESLKQLGRLDYVALTVGSIATKTTVLGAAAIATTGHVFSLASDLASISRAGFALPGILGGIVIGLGTTAAAFKDFNVYVPQASGYMSDLQDTISSNFWDEASKSINAFVDGVFPILNKNLKNTGTELGKFFSSLAESAGTTLNPALAGMFTHLNESIVIATTSTDSLVNIIKVLGETGASYLPSLAQWFTDITEKFSTFLTKAQEDGSLKAWIDEGITNLQALGSVLMSTYDILAGIAAAAQAAGGITLVGLSESLRGIAETVNSAAFQSGLTDTFAAAYETMRGITEGAGPALQTFLLSLKDTFITVGPALGESLGAVLGTLFDALAAPAVSEGLLAVFDGIQVALTNLQPAIGPTVAMLASLGPVFAALMTNISAIMATGIDKLGPTFTALAEASVPLINKLGELVNGVMSDLTPVFQQLGENATKVVQKFVPLVAAVQSLWNVIAPVLVPILKVVVQILGDALVGVITGVTMVFNGLVSIISGVVEVFSGLWDVVSGLFTLDFSKIGEGFSKIFGGLKDIVMGALEGVAGAVWAWANGTILSPFKGLALKMLKPFTKFLAPLGKVFTKAIDAVKPFFNWIVKGAEDGVKATGNVFTRIKDVLFLPFQKAWDVIGPLLMSLGGLFRTAFNAIKTIITTYISVWATIFKTAFKVIETVIRTAWTVITTIFSTVLGVIKTVITGAWNGIVTFFQSAMDGLYFLFKGPWDNILEFLTGLWNTIKATAMLVWDGIRLFIDDFLIKTQARMDEVWNAIKTAIETVWNAIKTAALAVWEAIKTAVVTPVKETQTKLGTVWDAIKTKVDNVWNKIKTKLDEVWESIKTNVKTAVEKVKTTLGDVWDNIKTKVDTVWEAVKKKIGDAWTTIKTKVDNATTDVKKLMADAWDAVKKKLDTAWDNIKTAVGDAIGDVKTKIGTLPQKAKDALVGIGTTLVNAGKSLIQGFIDGIAAKFDSVKGKLGELTSKLKDWKGPEPLDRVLLKPVGALIIDGLINGLESKFKDVRSSLQGLTKDIAGHFDTGTDYRLGVTADLDTSTADLSAIKGLSAKVNGSSIVTTADGGGAVHIDSITIPLEDLKQLNTLEEFVNMLRVRTRQGVAA